MLSTQEGIELLRRIAAEDRQALDDFYVQVAAPLFSVALRILNDFEEAEEVIQDAFVQIWQKAGTYDSTLGSPFHWALRVVRNRAIDTLRTRARRARLLEGLAQNAGRVGESGDSGQQTLAESDAASIRSAVAELPVDQREAIELAFFKGKTHNEIAQALNVPLGTVKARIRRGLLKLKTAWMLLYDA